ncbi:MAG TPA: hypothetical protein DEA22_13810 [Blastocatellia bacterium]|nr:hypothetical protein [Blastocatellia bacterium]
MKRKIIVLGLILSFAGFIFAAAGSQAEDFEIGATIGNFSLPATDGKTYSFNELKGKNGVVVIFLSAQCPVVKAYIERINQVAADYKSRGINFIGVNSNATESLEWVTSDTAENFTFPMLIDKGNVLADKLGATVTPETYYFNSDNVLLYHGAIDNDKSGKNIKTTYLRTAFDSALSGKPIERTKALAFGCSIKRVGEEK